MEIARLILAVAAAGGADARRLARDAQLPGWVLADRAAMIPSGTMFGLWERAEHALGDPFIGLRAASRHRLGDLGLYDYLFTTAATVGDGLAASGSFSRLVTTNGRLAVHAETDSDITYSYRHAVPGGRGGELCLQLVIAGYCARIRAATGRPLTPVKVAFTAPPPRTRRAHRALAERFGTARIDFGAPLATFTVSARDRDFPMPAADPVLAGILRRFAQSLPAPPAPSWTERVQGLLAEQIARGSPSLDALARQLLVSRRTLQRQFAERDTNWRAQLDTARRRRAELARDVGATGPASMARQLGYAGPRSVHRALRRWGWHDSQQESNQNPGYLELDDDAPCRP